MTSLVDKVSPVNGRVLVVAGSDPTAGAGLQADLKMITALGGYAQTVVTAITVQNTQEVSEVHPLSGALVARQMIACLDDIGADCIKLGMLATGEIVVAVAEILAQYPEIPVVADPVLSGTGGGTLLDGSGRKAFLQLLLPRVTLLTPNIPEAEALSGTKVDGNESMAGIAQILGGPNRAILLTGGHRPGPEIVDLLWTHRSGTHVFRSERLTGPGFHGTGCALASAISVGLASGMPLLVAVKVGLRAVRLALRNSLALGKGQRLLGVAAGVCWAHDEKNQEFPVDIPEMGR